MPAEAAAAGVQLLDSRGVGKVPTFTGEREDFEVWIFPFESCCGLLVWTAGLELARYAEEPLAVEQIGEQGDGFEAMRRLQREYRPRLNEVRGQMLQQIRTPLRWKDREGKERFAEVLIAWGELISRCERATGEDVAHNMKTSTIMARASDDVKTMLRSAQRDARSDIAQMRTCIFEAVIGQSGVMAKLPTAGRGSNDMGVDAISKGKGKQGGKNKRQLGTKPNHAARDCYWRDKDSSTFTGKCDYCRKTGGKKADCRKRLADEKAKGNAAIEQESADPKTVAKMECADFECEICDDEQLYCAVMKAEGGDAECCGMDLDGTILIALGAASDCRVGPTAFGEGCQQVADVGPRLLGAQRQWIKMGAVATVPMAVDYDDGQTKLLKADFGLGDTVSMPILSLLEVMDKVAEFWPSAKTGVCMCPGGDLAKGTPLARKNDTLGFNAKTFKTTMEEKEFAASVRANEQQEEFAQSLGASGSGGPGSRTRLRELGQPIYGREGELWTGLSDAERRVTPRRARMKELERRREESVQGWPSIAPRGVAGPAAPTEITLDFCYLQANGDWAEIGGEEPPAAGIVAAALVVADRGTLMFNAASIPTKAVTGYAVARESGFIEGMHLAAADINTDGEPTFLNLVEEARKKLSKSIELGGKRGQLKDGQSVGAIEAPIRWFQAKARTCKFDLGKRCGMKIAADAPIWCWLTRCVSWATSTYVPRADGGASHQAAFGVTYNGEILPLAETALFKVSTSHARQIAATSLERQGESSFVEGIWIGNHKESDDHLFLAPAGWHRTRTCRGLGPVLRADAKLMKAVKALPWEARGAEPCELLPEMQRPLPVLAFAAAEQKGHQQDLEGKLRQPPDLRHVDAISLDDPIDYIILDNVGAASHVATSGLGPAVELKGERGALEMLAHYGVHRDIPRSESGEFQDDQGALGAADARRSRLVDFASIREESHGTFIADCVKAYYQADQAEKVCVGSQPECLAISVEMGRSTGIVWALDRKLSGQRVAGAGWVDKAAKTFQGEGFERCECQPQFYHSKEKEILIEVHMDGLHGEGPIGNLGGIIERLREVFDLKDLIFVVGLEKAKPAKVPGLTEEGPTWSPDLDDVEKAKFRADVATCKETRSAMTCGVAKLDGVRCAAFATRQGVRTNVADLDTKAHPVARFECLRGLAGIVGCSEMGKHKELEACSVATSRSWARRGLLATLLAQGAAESATASTCEVESYKTRATDLVAAAIQVALYAYTGHAMTLIMVVVFLGGIACGCCCRKMMEPPEVKYTDKPMKTCEKGSSGPIASGKAKVKDTNQPIMLDKMSQAPCAYEW
ncbi:unnamed protein product, partial [Prorocentrum cordatum]